MLCASCRQQKSPAYFYTSNKTRCKECVKASVKHRAQNVLNNALRTRKVKKEACAICGAGKNVHAHHKDYARPLDVKWLCAKCHHRWHAAFPELGGHYQSEATA